MSKNRKKSNRLMAKLEKRKQRENSSVNLQSFGEIRSLNDDGTFEGYLTVWDTVDSYNSTFRRGSFAKTIQNRSSKVKVFYDHEHLVGSSIELREDDHGVYGKGKLNLSVDKAVEAYEFMKDGTLEGLSFSFRSIKDSYEAGVRVIEELELFEYGPVVFPANENALVTDVRSKDFNESLTQEMLYSRSFRVKEALSVTLDDIWGSGSTTAENVMGKIDKALMDFNTAYMEFAVDWVKTFWTETRSAPNANALAIAFTSHMLEQRSSVEEMASNSSFTTDELKNLKCGELVEARFKLSELPETVRLAHQEQRSKQIEALCSSLRDGLTSIEKRRIQALLTTPDVEERSKVDHGNVLKYLQTFNKTLGTENV